MVWVLLDGGETIESKKDQSERSDENGRSARPLLLIIT